MMIDHTQTPCEVCGEIKECWGYVTHDSKEHTLCSDHAAELGFCLNCGGYFGGTEEFMQTGIKGLCVDCEMGIKEENEDNEPDWEGYD